MLSGGKAQLTTMVCRGIQVTWHEHARVMMEVEGRVGKGYGNCVKQLLCWMNIILEMSAVKRLQISRRQYSRSFKRVSYFESLGVVERRLAMKQP